MGAFHAPHVTGEALKTAAFTAALFHSFGYDVTPKPDEPRGTSFKRFCSARRGSIVAFCQGVKWSSGGRICHPEP